MQALSSGRGVTAQIPLFTPVESPRDVDVAAISRPAAEYTGDFYFWERRDDTLWLVIGDVAGKGLEAAIVMAMIQEQLEECVDPATIARLNLSLRDILPRNRFATMAIAEIRDDGRLIVTNAGHCPLMIARRDGTIETIGSTGPVVGLLPNVTWTSVDVPFGRGDTLLAYTDGVVEARNASGEEFGEARLRTALLTAAGPARDVAAAILAGVGRHANADDDLTLIVARR